MNPNKLAQFIVEKSFTYNNDGQTVLLKFDLNITSLLQQKQESVRILPFILRAIEKKQTKFGHRSQLELRIRKQNLGVKGIRYITISSLPNLFLLNLGGNLIGNEGCHIIIQGQWNYLQKLFLWANNIGEKGCVYLASSNWSQIKTLSLADNPICRKGYICLTDKYFPRCQIICDEQYYS